MDRDLIWTGDTDELELAGRRVGFYDTTLRDGEQTVGVVLNPEVKELGVRKQGLVTDEEFRELAAS